MPYRKPEHCAVILSSPNLIKSNVEVGAVVGNPGTNPVGWSLYNPDTGFGISTQITDIGEENGIPYLEWRVFGTPTSGASGVAIIWTVGAGDRPIARIGDGLTLSCFIKLQSGTNPASYVGLAFNEVDVNNNYLQQDRPAAISPTGASLDSQQYTFTQTCTNSSCAFADPYFLVQYTVGTPVDCTYRIGGMRFQRSAKAYPRPRQQMVTGSVAPPPPPNPPPPPPPPNPPPSPQPPHGALVWQYNSSTFQASDAGSTNPSSPVFRTRFSFGRAQTGNGELGLYVDPVVYPGTNPYFIDGNGNLVLQATKLSSPIAYNGTNYNYTACVLEAIWIQQQYGYFETVCQSTSTPGTWPAFWILPSNGDWPPEIDVFEHPRNGQITASYTTATNHYNNSSGTHIIDSSTINLAATSGFPSNINLETSFHTYGLNWRSDFTTWYVDGIQIKQVATTFKQPAFPLWDVAVGGWGGTPNFSTGSTQMIISSASVYL